MSTNQDQPSLIPSDGNKPLQLGEESYQYLPPTHFLSLPRPSTSILSSSSTTFHNDYDSYHSPSQFAPLHTTSATSVPGSGAPAPAPDTTTLAAHDFDVDNRTGFMPPHPPIRRLPPTWELWEEILDDAIVKRLQLGEKRTGGGVTSEEQEKEEEESEMWRKRVRELPIQPISHALTSSETLLRRAHLVLAWIMHFYIHTLPPTSSIRIPPPITIPLLQVCDELQLPPVLTYSDDVLYNWHTVEDPDSTSLSSSSTSSPASSWTSPGIPPFPTLRTNTTFTSTPSESQFYLTSARMEFRGVEALSLMREMMDELFVSDHIAVRRVTQSLRRMKEVVGEMKGLLMDVREGVDVGVFYDEIRPWFRGEDSQAGAAGANGAGADGGGRERRKWVFEGLDEWNQGVDEYNLNISLESPFSTSTSTPQPTLNRKKLLPPTDLSGASAGQSTLIHSLDIFLGVRSATKEKEGLVMKMQRYMPRYHRAFLSHLMSTKRTLRQFVLDVIGGDLGLINNGDDHDSDNHNHNHNHNHGDDSQGYLGNGTSGGWTPGADSLELELELDREMIGKEEREALRDAYNGAVLALKELRDGHMIIVAQYILAPARRHAAEVQAARRVEEGGGIVDGVVDGMAEGKGVPTKGTGGTDVVRFLKGVRDLTAETVISG